MLNKFYPSNKLYLQQKLKIYSQANISGLQKALLLNEFKK